MDIFVSWSGEQSKIVAASIKENIRLAIQRIGVFFSTEDIRSGAKWSTEIGSNLAKCNYGIICVTRKNLDSKWLHFEAGAIAKQQDESNVCSYLIDVQPSEVEGPLSQFQNRKADEEDTWKLLEDINNTLPEPERLQSNELKTLFDDVFWRRLNKAILHAKSLEEPGEPTNHRSDSSKLDELINLMRSIARDENDVRNKKRRRQAAVESSPQELAHAVLKMVNELLDEGDVHSAKSMISGLDHAKLDLLLGQPMSPAVRRLIHEVCYDRSISPLLRDSNENSPKE